ncbi:hypothetical protein J7J84_02720 [bacterium]|nr:hypothetical protein [bacterium]
MALPVENATFDPDGDGEAVATTVQVYELEGVEGSRYGTFSYYFDYEWNGPNGTTATVVLATANGEYVNANISLSLDWLPPWPY